MKLFALLLLLLAGAGARAAPTLALGDGESLVYHVSWIVVPGAGEIRVSARSAAGAGGTPQLRISTTTSTRGLARVLLPFEARAESLFDPATGLLLSQGESSETRSRHLAHTVVFDYAKRLADYSSELPPLATVALPMPAGEPTDLITCLMLARTWNLKPGQKHEALVLFEDDFYQLEPRMELTPPKGMFKRGSTVRVWVSQDAHKLPVRFQLHLGKFGSGIATLAQYHPPAR